MRYRCLPYGDGGCEVLHKQNTLSLDDEEVDELVDVANSAVQGLARDCVILARTELRCKTIAKNQLTSHLGSDSDAEGHTGQLERPSDDIEVARGKDQGNDGGVCNSGSAYCR